MNPVLRRVVTVAAALLLSVGLLPTTAAHAETHTPYGSTVRFTGYGWGHGWGMSQYGARGAAERGLSWQQILGFYYPGTSLASLPSGQRIRIWLTADSDSSLTVRGGIAGLRLRATANNYTYTFPTTLDAKQWRISRNGSVWELHRLDSAGKWHQASTGWLPSSGNWLFENTRTGVVSVVLPGNSTGDYRGTVALVRDGSTLRTVNGLPMEDYLRGVVPAEMPASWAANAVRAQAVAARTYAAKRLRPSEPYDLCDTTSCQVYRGVSGEAAGGDAAVSATARRILTYGGQPIDALFSSSNGGHTVDGNKPYLPAKPDPYDGVTKFQGWTTTRSAAEIGSAFGIGTLRSLKVIDRDGGGRLGGRIDRVSLTGSTGTVEVSGATLRARLGLRSSLVRATGGLADGSANERRWADLGDMQGKLGVPTGDEFSVAGGTAVRFGSYILMQSSSTGSHEVHGLINRRYWGEMDGPATLGLPVTDEIDGPLPGSRMSRFQKGTFLWSHETGAWEMHGLINRRYWNDVDGPTTLGLPVTDEIDGPLPGSRMSKFQKGTFLWSPGQGAWEMHGSINRRYWNDVDGPTTLGLPVSDEIDGPVSGSRMSKFQKGTFLWSPGEGAWEMHGAINRRYWTEVDGPTILGLPVSDEIDGPVSGSRMSKFQKGVFLWSPATGAHEVHGAILRRYGEINGAALLGLPTSDELVGARPGSRKSAFARGGIYWSSATGPQALWGPTWQLYRSMGEERSYLGLPVSEPVTSGTSTTTRFQGGTIVCSGSSCTARR